MSETQVSQAQAGTSNPLDVSISKGPRTEAITAAAINVPVTVANDSSVNVERGQVTLQNQESSETITLNFGFIARGTAQTQQAPFNTGAPDKVIYRFIPVDHSGDWFGLNVSTSGGFTSVLLHLTD